MLPEKQDPAVVPVATKRKYVKKNSPAVSPETPEKQDLPAAPEEDGSPVYSPLQLSILELLAQRLPKADVLYQTLIFNRQQDEPVSNDEVLATVEALIATQETEMGDFDLLFKLTDELILLFSDDLAEPHFFCQAQPFRAPSKQVMALVRHRFYLIKKYMPGKKVVNAVFDILESKARFDSPKVKMFNRVANKEGALYYDLCDKRFLKVTATNWEIVPAFPLVRRYKHQQSQVEPVTGGDPWELFNFLTIPEEDHLLLLVFLISLFVAGIAHPVLAVFGDQGSAKSFLCNIINRLIDPTLTERIIQPKNERDLIQTLRQKYVTVLDNMSIVTHRVSDILCQVCTGGGVSYRQLYTDEGENIAQFRHVVILNSIRLPIVNADLMDRAIIFKLLRIAPEDRRPEQELWQSFESAQPRILGGIFDTLVKAMAIYPSVNIDKLPRLADFAKWGYAIAEALGKSGDQFLDDFAQNVVRQNESVAEKNVLCQAVICLMDGKTSHLNTVSEIHKELKALVGEDAKDETFPKLPHNMRGQLDLLRSTLLEHSISYQYFDRQKTGVKVLFTNSATITPEEPTESLPAAQAPQLLTLVPAKSQSKLQPASPATPIEAANLLIPLEGVADDPGEPENGIPTIDFDEAVNV